MKLWCIPLILAIVLLVGCSKKATGENVLSFGKHLDTEKGEVVDHSDGNGNHELEQQYINVQYVSITARVDTIDIVSVSVNKGDCAVVSTITLPTTLKFGEVLQARLFCNPLEISVETKNNGTISASWDQ